ncbi:MAG: helix-turn-helix domain-containing protein [Rhodanobacter sp.]
MSYGYGSWKPYVPVAARRAKVAQQAKKLIKAGHASQPVSLKGRLIASSFWGKGWCKHLEALSDFENRLPRGRSYVRNGSVCHLAIQAGRIDALVMGSSLYRVSVDIKSLSAAHWRAIKKKCSGEIGSLLELLQGRLSDQVMAVVTDHHAGLFPQPGQMTFACSCPDWASMCKHVAAVLYGVGSRLDEQPQLLFQLRDVDATELIDASLDLSTAGTSEGRLADDKLGAIFGIELEAGDAIAAMPGTSRKPKPARAAPPKKSPARSRDSVSSPPRKNNHAPVREFQATAKSIAALRKKHGWSVAEFATRLNVSPASVQRWEAAHGTLKLHDRCLAALAALHRDRRGVQK